MPKAEPASRPNEAPNRIAFVAATLLLITATVISYSNSLNGPFIFDDISAIYENPTIRDLTKLGDILQPPSNSGVTVNGRPLVNLTLAANHAFGGYAVQGYHFVNATIHLLASLTLFGLVRRLTAQQLQRSRYDRTLIAGAATFAALWALHPLQTQSVTYVIQRAEALVGLFYLLTLYTFVRGQEQGSSRWWGIATVVSCLLGVASKEVIVSAPIVVLLCDRTFFSGTFIGAWRSRRWLYLGLFATWVPLAWQIHSAGGRGGTVGFGIDGVTWWMYLLTQADALTRYLFAAGWPARLVFDYGTGVTKSISVVWPQLSLIAALLAGTLYALVRAPVVGFLAASFFLILAPSSSFVPIVTESMAEHRMYLPVMTVLGLAAVALVRLLGGRTLPAFILAAAALGLLTYRRNQDYRSDLEIWRSSVSHYPISARAHNNYGEALARIRRYQEAIEHYREAIRLLPKYRDALCNLGSTLHRTGEQREGMRILTLLMQEAPDVPDIVCAFGGACYREGRFEEARRSFERTIALNPNHAEANNNLAVMLNDAGQPHDAIAHLQSALKIRPIYADALYNYATCLAKLGDSEGAKRKLLETLAIDAKYPEAHNNLGAILYGQGRTEEAARHFEMAIEERPDYPDALNNLGVLRLQAGRAADAIPYLEKAYRLQPAYTSARENLELARRIASGQATLPKSP